MYDLEIYKNGTLNAFDTVEIHDEETAKQALLKSDGFMTLTSWARAKQLYEISKYLTKAKIVEICTALNKTQIYDDIQTGKYVSLIDKITIFDDKDNGLFFKNYSTFTLFVKYITNIVKDIVKGFSKQDKLDYTTAKRKTHHPLQIESFEKAVELEIGFVGYKTVKENPEIFTMSAKEFKAWASGKDLTQDGNATPNNEPNATPNNEPNENGENEPNENGENDPQVDEIEQQARELFEKVLKASKKSNNYSVNDIALRFINQANK